MEHRREEQKRHAVVSRGPPTLALLEDPSNYGLKTMVIISHLPKSLKSGLWSQKRPKQIWMEETTSTFCLHATLCLPADRTLTIIEGWT